MDLFSMFKGGKYFDKHIEPKCDYCQFGKRAKDGNKVLCEKRGLVDCNYSCNKFVYSPLKRIPVKQLNFVGSLADEDIYIESAGDRAEKEELDNPAPKKPEKKAEPEKKPEPAPAPAPVQNPEPSPAPAQPEPAASPAPAPAQPASEPTPAPAPAQPEPTVSPAPAQNPAPVSAQPPVQDAQSALEALAAQAVQALENDNNA